MSTKKNILNALRRENLSITQLCERLSITRNAISVQLKQLQAEGLVRTVNIKRNGLLGKPAAVYQAAPHSEDVSSRAYAPLAASLITTVSERLEQNALADILEQTGRNMARKAGLSEPVNFEKGLKAATKMADLLGATTQVVRENNEVIIRNYSCPLGAIVRTQSCVCQVMAGFFSEATGHTVAQECKRDDRLMCQYRININA